jgi:hypothetical protein
MSKFGGKEPWMASMNAFVETNTSAFVDYIAHICTPSPESKAQWTSPTYGLYLVPLATRSRLRGLAREGIPDLPHLVDQAKDLAAFVAILARSQGSEVEPSTPGAVRRRRSRSSKRLFEVCHDIHQLTLSRARAAIELCCLPSLRNESGTTRSFSQRDRELSGRGAIARSSTIKSTMTTFRTERPSTSMSNAQPSTPPGSPPQSSSLQGFSAMPNSSRGRAYRSQTMSMPPNSSGMLRQTSSSDPFSSEVGVAASTPVAGQSRARADTAAADLRPTTSPHSVASTSEWIFSELDSERPPPTASKPVIAISVLQTTTTSISRTTEFPTYDGPYGPYPLSEDLDPASDLPLPGPSGDTFVTISAGPTKKQEGGIWRKLRR